MRCGERWATTLKDSNLTVSATGWLSLVLKCFSVPGRVPVLLGDTAAVGVGTGRGTVIGPESVVARQAVRKIAGEAGYCDTWGKTSAVIVVREGRVSWGTPSRDQLVEDGGATGRGGRQPRCV